MQVQLTQEAKIASDFFFIRAIFAVVGFVSALSRSRMGRLFSRDTKARGAFVSLRALFCALHLRHDPGEGDDAAFFVGDDEEEGAVHRHFHKFRLLQRHGRACQHGYRRHRRRARA